MTAARLTPPFLDDPAVAAVLAALPRARVVGGAVRDTLAGLPVADLDLATPDPPEAVMEMLTAAGLKVVPTGLAHGTVTAVSAGRPIEVTTLRRDVATDGRHAEVAFTDDWREDAARRDFTINAMVMDRDGLVHDWFGGRDDLAAGRVRFVGEPAQRLAEDYLRALRFFRFHARYGRGAADPAAITAITAAVPGLRILSAERVWSELKRILAAPDPVDALVLMRRSGVLGAVLPEAGDVARLGRLVLAGAPRDALLRLASLAPDILDPGMGEGACARLRLSNDEAARLATMQGSVPDPSADDAALRRALADAPAAALIDRAWLAAAEPRPGDWATLAARLGAVPRPVFPLAGADVVALGIAPGPAIGALLAATRAWWVAGGCVAGRADCLAALRQRASSR